MQSFVDLLCLSVGCASAHIETGMVTQASAHGAHVIWTRPWIGLKWGAILR